MKNNTMISIATARQLKKAGLQWTPAEHDFFAIPYNDLDEQVFVISDMSVLVEAMGNEMTITFNGTMEWALDHLVVGVRDGHASAVLPASIFHFGVHTIAEAKAHMAKAGIPVRHISS